MGVLSLRLSTRVLSWTQHNILGWLAELGSGLSYTYALGKSHKERSQSCESDWKTIIEVLARNMPFIFACPLAIMFPSSFIQATGTPPEANRHLLQSRTAKLGMGLPRTKMAEQKAIKKILRNHPTTKEPCASRKISMPTNPKQNSGQALPSRCEAFFLFFLSW